MNTTKRVGLISSVLEKLHGETVDLGSALIVPPALPRIGKVTAGIWFRASATHYQIGISLIVYAAVWGVELARLQNGGVSYEPRVAVSIIGAIGSITALVTSVSFAYLVFDLTQLKNRKLDLYFRFKNMLFDMDRSFKDESREAEVMRKWDKLAWNLKFTAMDDFPPEHWDDLVWSIVESIELKTSEAVEPTALPSRLAGCLAYLEEVAAEIEINSVRQHLSRAYFKLVMKAFVLLSLMLGTLVLAYAARPLWLTAAIAASPAFFAAFVALLFAQLSYFLYRQEGDTR